jgi:cytochrome P450
LHELLTRDGLFDQLVGEAREQDPQKLAQASPLARVSGYVWEALRFRPAFPLLPRYCPRRTTLAYGTPLATEVPAGATVFVSPLAAMFDPAFVDKPEQFIPSRSTQPHYVFGWGLHRCLGERLAYSAIPRLLLKLIAKRKINGAGRIVFDGPAVASYRVHCGPVADDKRAGAA